MVLYKYICINYHSYEQRSPKILNFLRHLDTKTVKLTVNCIVFVNYIQSI